MSSRAPTPVTSRLGVGLGWRPELDHVVPDLDLGFLEVVAENVDPDRLPAGIHRARGQGLAVVPHGLRLSLGGGERPDPARLDRLARVAAAVEAPLISEHIAFVRAGGLEAGHVMAVERTEAALDVLTENVSLAARALPVPLALEHVATLVEWPGAEMDEAAFVAELLERTDVLLLLDVSNLYANAHNHGYDALAALGRYPLERIAYVHVGGGVHRDGRYHDTHSDPVVTGVLELVEHLCARIDPPGILLERDDNFPGAPTVTAELEAIRAAAARGDARRAAHAG
jgi:uncharacterized protein (UPF0276 family)